MALHHHHRRHRYYHHHHWTVLLVAIATMYTTSEAKMVDLSHDLSKNTYMALPGMHTYTTSIFYNGEISPGVFARALDYAVSEHGGTHIDAPAHFNRDGQSLEQIPIENTVASGILIDCSAEVANDPHYSLTLQKVLDWEVDNGKIPKHSAVVLNFNWSHKYLNSTLYLDPTNPTDSTTFRFPTVTEEAIDFLVDERDINILALDTMSPDLLGTTYPVHVKLAKRNKLLVENVKAPERLPVRGFRFFACPVKFVGGTGLQTRVFAMVGDADDVFGNGAVGGSVYGGGGGWWGCKSVVSSVLVGWMVVPLLLSTWVIAH